jgi:cobalamin biosynthesis protein CbiG
MYKPLSGPSDLLKGKLSGSEHTRKGSAANAEEAIAAITNATVVSRERVELILSLNMKNLRKNKVDTLKKLSRKQRFKSKPCLEKDTAPKGGV